MTALCEVWRMGTVPYDEAWTLQDELVAARSRDEVPDRLLLLEHPHTFTLGSAGHEEYVLWSPQQQAQYGVQVVRIDRGGDVTYHGPGQVVGYPIMQLPRTGERLRLDVSGYLRNLETVIIRTLADFGITGYPIPELTGVWVDTLQGPGKICAIGVRINVRAVTKHGFALNVNTDMDYFGGIIPCGIRDKGVVSLSQLMGEPVPLEAVHDAIIRHFGAVFDRDMQLASPRL